MAKYGFGRGDGQREGIEDVMQSVKPESFGKGKKGKGGGACQGSFYAHFSTTHSKVRERVGGFHNYGSNQFILHE